MNEKEKKDKISAEDGQAKIDAGTHEEERLKFDELKFIRITYPSAFEFIPRYLFEQIPHRNWEVERIYEYAPFLVSNPLNRFWVLVTPQKLIKGVLWITIDPLTLMVTVEVCSLDREYQSINGTLRNRPSPVIQRVIDFLHKFQDELKEQGGAVLKRNILWPTTRPKSFQRAGAQLYKITMEM